MDEPPGTRLRVALSALTMAEYFRDVQNQDVLLFIDNIFRFTQAGSEVSTLLGRMPSAVGYQPTLADEMGELQERITSTRGHSITSMQAIYVPADDITDPAPRTTFAHLDATTVLSRPIIARRASTRRSTRSTRRRASSTRSTSARSTTTSREPGEADPAALQGPAGHHRDPRHRRALRRGQGDGRAAPVASSASSSQNTFVAKAFTGIEGSFVPLDETIEAFNKISDGDYDHLPEQAFFMCGGIDDVEQKCAAELQKSLTLMAENMQVELVSADRQVWSGEADWSSPDHRAARSASCPATRRCSVCCGGWTVGSGDRRRDGRRRRSRRVPLGGDDRVSILAETPSWAEVDVERARAALDAELPDDDEAAMTPRGARARARLACARTRAERGSRALQRTVARACW